MIMAVVLLSISETAFSQQRVKLKSSDYVEGGKKNGVKYNKAIGNVHFIQGTMDIYCDSAFLYKKENSLEAYGHIKIFDSSDSVTITSDRLTYAGDTKFAQLRQHVVYHDDSIVLFTDHLDYNIVNRSAYYFEGGRILSKENELTSITGFYDTPNKMLTFHQKVVLINPQNTLKTDTLIYNMVTGVAITHGPTTIIQPDGTTAYSTTGGEFMMHKKQTTIRSGTIETESYILKGNRLFYDEIKKVNRASGNVYMYSKNDNVIITGDEADNNQVTGVTKIYGHPVLKKLFMNDTLYLSADTLVSIDTQDSTQKRLLAYRHVKMFKTDMQGIADSISYVMIDSMLYLYDDPVIWNTGNQAEGDSISIEFSNNQINKMNLIDDAFIILTDTVGNFNQLKGKIMTTYFKDNKIHLLEVDGNSECLFYALDDKDNSLKGINHIVCSNMTLRFVNNRADNMSFYNNPVATFTPPQLIKKDDKQLSGFDWREKDRPTLAQVLENQEDKSLPGNPEKTGVEASQ